MQVTITAKDAAELRAKIIDLYAVFGGENTTNQEQTTFPPSMMAPMPTPETHPPNKRGPKPKVQVSKQESAVPEMAVNEIVIPATPQAAPQAPQIPLKTRDDARAALEKLNEAKGLEIARSVLAQYECKRLSELKEEYIPSFVETCHQQIAG